MPNTKAKNKQKILLLSTLAISILEHFQPHHPPRIQLGATFERALCSPSLGLGRGAPGRRRHRRRSQSHSTLRWNTINRFDDLIRLQHLIHMSTTEFRTVLEDMKESGLDKKLSMSHHNLSQFLTFIGPLLPKLSFGDKVLLFFVWIVQYPHLSVMVVMFGYSNASISAFLHQVLPYFVGFFSSFISNKIHESFPRSHLSPYVVGIIDGTVHKIRCPSVNQHLWWNDNYQCHAVHSLFLVSLDGEIISVATGIPGSFHDSCASSHVEYFEEVLEDKLVLGDPGFAGVSYVVSGLKSNQVSSPAHKHFDRLSRSEQVAIEHVNNFVKKCKILSDSKQFIHSNEVLSGCVIVGAGLYNYMYKKFGKYLK